MPQYKKHKSSTTTTKKRQLQSFSFAIEKKENNKRTQTKLEQCTSIYSLNAATKCFTPSARPFSPFLHFPDSPTELITKLVQSRACFLDFGCCCTEIFFICMEIESASKRTYKKSIAYFEASSISISEFLVLFPNPSFSLQPKCWLSFNLCTRLCLSERGRYRESRGKLRI